MTKERKRRIKGSGRPDNISEPLKYASSKSQNMSSLSAKKKTFLIFPTIYLKCSTPMGKNRENIVILCTVGLD